MAESEASAAIANVKAQRAALKALSEAEAELLVGFFKRLAKVADLDTKDRVTLLHDLCTAAFAKLDVRVPGGQEQTQRAAARIRRLVIASGKEDLTPVRTKQYPLSIERWWVVLVGKVGREAADAYVAECRELSNGG